jgi:hypothetical protein
VSALASPSFGLPSAKTRIFLPSAESAKPPASFATSFSSGSSAATSKRWIAFSPFRP